LWLSYYEVGIDVYDIKYGVIKRYRYDIADTNSLTSNVIMRINRLDNNKLGFVTENGYCIFDPKDELFHRNNMLSGLSLFDVYHDKSGNYWLSTKGSGFWILWADGKIEKFDKSNGFPSNVACGILEDNKGNIWISSYSGLSEYIIQTKTFRHYTIADGLQGNQFTPFASLKASDGTLYFGGFNGFNSFHPDSIKTNSFIPPVYINEFQIFNIPVTHNTPNSPLSKSISVTQEIVLTYLQSVFSFGFMANNFTYPKKAIYAYKMEGYDKDWNYTDNNRRYATYTNLDPGKYTFMVKATNNDSVWNENPVSIKIEITPPWWKTWWSRSISMLLIFSLAITFYRLRVASLKQSKKELEIKVAERTEELKKTNLKLAEHASELEIVNAALEDKQKQILHQNEKNIQITKQLNEANQVKNRFFTNISHEFRTPLTLILGPLDSIISNPAINKSLLEKLSIIKGNANRLLRLVNQLLELRNIDSENIPLLLEEHDIVQFIRNVYNLFNLKAENKQISYNFITHYEKLSGQIDSDKLEKIVFNLLSNAFKFTPDAGEISVMLEVDTSTVAINNKVRKLIITVMDNGPGIKKEDLPHIFERFYQSDSSLTRKYEGSGIGLALSKEFVEIHSGTISVESEPGKGSCFRVEIPVEFSDELFNEKTGVSVSDSLKTSINQKKPITPVRKGVLPVSTILVVEDNVDLRHYLNTELENEFTVLEACNGQSGMEKAKAFLPDIVISDVMMPVMDGFRFCEQMKTEWLTSHIPIILLTAKSDVASFYQGLEIGADAYIAKPFEMRHLLAQINNLILNRKKILEKFSSAKTSIKGTISVDSPESEMITKIMKIIEENLDNAAFGVDLLADRMNMSRSLLYKKVIATTNISIGEIIRDTRLERAAQLLRENRHSILEIAQMVGFTDRPQFTRSFTSKYGIGPKQYQQNNNKHPH